MGSLNLNSCSPERGYWLGGVSMRVQWYTWSLGTHHWDPLHLGVGWVREWNSSPNWKLFWNKLLQQRLCHLLTGKRTQDWTLVLALSPKNVSSNHVFEVWFHHPRAGILLPLVFSVPSALTMQHMCPFPISFQMRNYTSKCFVNCKILMLKIVLKSCFKYNVISVFTFFSKYQGLLPPQ